jgi:hypothetical protein
MSSRTKRIARAELDKRIKPTQQGDKPMTWNVFYFDRVMGPEDLKPRRGINIEPPPSDARCDCCGRHISELTPFGGRGDPMAGDLSGVLLNKMYRRTIQPDEEVLKAWHEAEKRYKADGYDNSYEWLKAKYGQEKAHELVELDAACSQIGASWECRDCAILYTDEYFEKLRRRYQERAAGLPEEAGPQ